MTTLYQAFQASHGRDGPDFSITVICGHTHMQFDRMVGATHVVNAGSVGMPFGDTRAYWFLLGTEIQLRCKACDLEEACHQIAATGFPNAGEFANGQIALPPDEQMMLEIFGRAELSPLPYAVEYPHPWLQKNTRS